jgi:hypothetical protein
MNPGEILNMWTIGGPFYENPKDFNVETFSTPTANQQDAQPSSDNPSSGNGTRNELTGGPQESEAISNPRQSSSVLSVIYNQPVSSNVTFPSIALNVERHVYAVEIKADRKGKRKRSRECPTQSASKRSRGSPSETFKWHLCESPSTFHYAAHDSEEYIELSTQQSSPVGSEPIQSTESPNLEYLGGGAEKESGFLQNQK